VRCAYNRAARHARRRKDKRSFCHVLVILTPLLETRRSHDYAHYAAKREPIRLRRSFTCRPAAPLFTPPPPPRRRHAFAYAAQPMHAPAPPTMLNDTPADRWRAPSEAPVRTQDARQRVYGARCRLRRARRRRCSASPAPPAEPVPPDPDVSPARRRYVMLLSPFCEQDPAPARRTIFDGA